MKFTAAKFLSAAVLSAALTAPAMAAEELALNEMDNVTAGFFNFGHLNRIGHLNLNIAYIIQQASANAVAPKVCGAFAHCGNGRVGVSALSVNQSFVNQSSVASQRRVVVNGGR